MGKCIIRAQMRSNWSYFLLFVEKSNNNNSYEFDTTSTQQILDNTPIKIEPVITNESAYNSLNNADLYTTQKLHNVINPAENELWNDYRSSDVVTSEFFTQDNMNSLLSSRDSSGNSSATFDSLYRQQIPSANFQGNFSLFSLLTIVYLLYT